jgi:hypothetical protein
VKKEDERERKIHAESARNAFFIAVAITGALLVRETIPSGEINPELMTVFLGTQITYVVSVLYYRRKGLRNSLSLSKLRSK